VERGGTVEEDGVLFGNFFQNIKNFRLPFFDQHFGGFDVRSHVLFDQFVKNKRLEHFESHVFGKTTLVEFKFRADDDHGTAGVIDAFTQ